MKLDLQYQKLLKVVRIIFVLYTVLFLAVSCTNQVIMKPLQHLLTASKGILFMVNAFVFENNSIGYILILYIIHFRLSQLNGFIEKASSGKYSTKQTLRSLKSLSLSLNRICEILEGLKFFYSINNIAYLTHYAVYSLLSIYGFISYFFQSGSTSFDLRIALFTLSWELYYTPFIVWIFTLAGEIKTENVRTEKLLQRLLSNNYLKPKVLKRIKLLTLQLEHQSPAVEHGMFVIDWKLLFGGMCACVSYLVIIIQFEIITK